MILKQLGTGQGYLKAGFLGFPKSGKTLTAVYLACEVHRMFGLKSPIAFFDTEGGSEYVADIIKNLSGVAPIGVRSRSFQDLMSVAQECEKEGIEILLVDSITHVWRELCDAYLKQINERMKSRNRSPRRRLEFQDWQEIKAAWSAWPDWYLNSKVHIAISGRAGFEWDFETTEDSRGEQRKELVKTGVKMKVESEFGFEPSLLVEMERVQDLSGDVPKISRRAVVLGDRFRVIDGKSCEFPSLDTPELEMAAVAAFFGPHIKKLTVGAHSPVDVGVKTDLGVGEDGDGEWAREKRERTILCEEIQGVLVNSYPGQTKEEKQAKADLIFGAFGTRSWTKVESLDAQKLRAGLGYIEVQLGVKKEPKSAFETFRDRIAAAVDSATVDKIAADVGERQAELAPDDLQSLLNLLEEAKLNV